VGSDMMETREEVEEKWRMVVEGREVWKEE
jgi:hypothetical protein